MSIGSNVGHLANRETELLHLKTERLYQGRIQWAVRPLSDQDFIAILDAGFPADATMLPRIDDEPLFENPPGFSENQEPFIVDQGRNRIEQTISRIDRSRVFRTHVLAAYENRCAITGLRLINGRGRAEVEAAHIKPVIPAVLAFCTR